MDYLSQKVHIVHSELNPDLFVLQSIDLGSVPFSATVLPACNRKPHERIPFSSWRALMLPQTVTPATVTSADQGSFYNAAFDANVIFTVFQRLLPAEPAEVSYADLKQQWSLLTRQQFLNSPELRARIRALESAIKGKSRDGRFERFSDPPLVQKTVFELLLTYSLYNWDGTRVIDGLIDLVLPFVDAYILQNQMIDDNCAPAVFSVFSIFYEKNDFSEAKASKPQYMHGLLSEVGARLKSTFPELLHLLTQKHVFSLDFLRHDVSRWFVDVFDDENVRVLWISILSFSSPKEFFESFLIALLLMVTPQLAELIPLSSREFVARFDAVKKGVDLRTLLLNTQKIHGMCHPPS
jgi:hypothetical protein